MRRRKGFVFTVLVATGTLSATFGGAVFADVASDKATVKQDFQTLETDGKALRDLMEQLRTAKKAGDQATVAALKPEIKQAEQTLKADEAQLKTDFQQLQADEKAAGLPVTPFPDHHGRHGGGVGHVHSGGVGHVHSAQAGGPGGPGAGPGGPGGPHHR